MKKFLLAIFALMTFGMSASAQVRVVDADNNEPVDAASVFNNDTKTLIGLTDEQGTMPKGAEKAGSLIVQHINYGSMKIAAADIKNDTIRMKSLTFSMPEVTVEKDPDKILRMKTYIRSYSYVCDKPMKVSESICYLYFKNGEEGRPKVKKMSELAYTDVKALGEQSTAIQVFADDDESQFFRIHNYPLYDALKEGARVTGHRGDRKVCVYHMKEDSLKQTCEITLDSGYVDRPFNFPLFRISISDHYRSEKYTTAYGKPKLVNLLSCMNKYRVTMNKTKKTVDIVAEYYPLEFDYVTKDEMKEQRKDKQRVKFERPAGMPPLVSVMEEAKKTMTITEQ